MESKGGECDLSCPLSSGAPLTSFALASGSHSISSLGLWNFNLNFGTWIIVGVLIFLEPESRIVERQCWGFGTSIWQIRTSILEPGSWI